MMSDKTRDAINHFDNIVKICELQLESDRNDDMDIKIMENRMLYASMAITALKNQEKNKPVGGWISVKDQLPADFEHVLICHKQGVTTGYSVMGESEELQYWRSLNNKHRMLTTVTHWMPLPEPPKERDSDV